MAQERDDKRWADAKNRRLEASRRKEADDKHHPGDRPDRRKAREHEEPERWDGLS